MEEVRSEGEKKGSDIILSENEGDTAIKWGKSSSLKGEA